MRCVLCWTLLMFAGFVPPQLIADSPEIQEWQVPWPTTRPRDPFAQSERSVWFVGQGGGYLARLDPGTGEFEKVALKKGSAPHNLIVDDDGSVWYAGNRTALIGRYDPDSSEFVEYPMPDSAAGDPHTLVFDEAQENIWFTVQQGNFMGRLNLVSGKVDLIPSRTERSRPYGIKMAPDGSVWVVLFGSNKLAHIQAETMKLTEIELPKQDARPRRLEISRDGSVWYADYARGSLGRYKPESGTFSEWPMPQGTDARPYGMALDSSGKLWLVATGVQPNIFIGFDPESETWFGASALESGGGSVRHMHYHRASGTVWFGTDANTIGRAVVEGR